jgi:sugar lactone lactonase YvrE
MKNSCIFIAFAFGMFFPFHTAFAQTAYEVLVTSRSGNTVQRYDENGNYMGDFVKQGSGSLQWPQDILFHPDGTVLVSGFGNGAIKRYNGKTGAFIGNFSTGYSLKGPSKMSMGPDNLVYVTQWDSVQNKVVRFDLQGNYVDEFTQTGAPKGLGHVWDSQGNFYISLYGNGGDGTVHKYDAQGNDQGTFINSNIIQGPTDLWWDGSDLLVADYTTGKVWRFDSTGQYVSTFISGLTNPEGKAFLPNGNILIGDWGIDGVHLVQPNGTITGLFCSGNGLTDPNCVRVRPSPTVSVQAVVNAELSVVPTTGRSFTITVPRAGSKIEITNMSGTIVHRAEVKGAYIWNAGNQPAGMYIISVKGSDTSLYRKVMVRD